jgi:hypothetical protein
MKGLLFSSTGKKEEGLDMAKRGARFDLTSHIVWHVLGLIHKADRNYEEAQKSFVQALRFDKVCNQFCAQLLAFNTTYRTTSTSFAMLHRFKCSFGSSTRW